MNNEIVIYCDSSCDLTIQEYKDLDVKLIPLITTVKGKDYLDRVDLEPKEFYEMLKEDGVVPKTTMINPQRFVEEFKEDMEKQKKIIFLSISSGISSSYNSAVVAKEMTDYKDLYIIDSLGASVGAGLLLRKTAEMRNNNKTVEEIIEEITFMKNKMEYLFCPGSLEMLKRGGRISSTKAAIGTILNIKPICHFDKGYIKMFSKVRGQKALIKFYINYLKENGYNSDYRFAIGHANNMKLVNALKEALNKNFGIDNIIVGDIGAVIGSHTGEGTVTLSFVGK
ncbi:DegV family protein [Oceanirhabdus sp. W0125-5]|uniref:DegV family protein n=1 Tax=Oceanirhabdus sp. W0125-5 TaxID=2999116 RepID=UPI0022F32773|nr:DegV family protein [Oceanirhabdus sp. W0125-5]WBW95979.1 DegV family protein [Oceanirhabdus sp. W0125-5]